ncbi:uncharacterized protein LOC130674123 isoform X3 [Microplitis mediator]|uniref:uncharacterized protein LOC130674123 isoform X3 n=1 Tax=Microplitis mediator TaxID=375433 RepID=UPI0025579A90|nr:uncharacterized protein LOC130674123 isoform X3 [Microplitis mediator]
MINNYNKSEVNTRLCLLLDDLEMQEDPRTASLRRISYGIILPAICCLGIIGNIFNLVVLTRKNMRGTAYIYMRGIHNGICEAIEKRLGKDLIWLPCRHHIFEIILKSAFEVYWPVTSGPNVPMLGRFKNAWDQIDKTNYKSGIEDNIVDDFVSHQKHEISSFITQSLQLLRPRDDYKEFFELSLIFLGEMPQGKVYFKRPGAVHHARWMAKGIYSLKMFMFRDEFRLSNKELHGLRQFSIFIVVLYLKAWFSSTSATTTAHHDLQFLKNLIEYKRINPLISAATCEKIILHLWYLSNGLAILSLFDDTVPLEMKKKILLKLLRLVKVQIAKLED